MKLPPLLLAFDIETSEQAQDGKTIPITVASTVTYDVVANSAEKRAWFSILDDPSHSAMIGSGKDEKWDMLNGKLVNSLHIAPTMSKNTAQAMLQYMDEKKKQGYVVCAWNGAAFDLQMLGAVAENMELAGNLAIDLLDPMYQILSQKGFPVGLKAVAAGLGIDQTKSMDGKDAPEAWLNGEYQKVISYVVGDSEMTIKMMVAIAKNDGIKWVTLKGKPASLSFSKFKTVIECFNEPQVDQSWMGRNPNDKPPINKKQVLSWIPKSVLTKSTEEVKKTIAKESGDACQGILPILFVLSGPSGAGKTLIREELMRTTPSVKKSTTVTTRPIRKGETDGVDYLFVSEEKFDKMIENGDFFEHAKIHNYRYGSSKIDISKRLAAGEDIMVIMDVQGAENIRKFYSALPTATQNKFRLADIFLTVPSIEVLRTRLTGRGTDDQETIELRLTNAKAEMARVNEYKYVVTNDDLHQTWDKMRSIVVAERCLQRLPRP